VHPGPLWRCGVGCIRVVDAESFRIKSADSRKPANVSSEPKVGIWWVTETP
jgi:hypothetical protein